MNTQVIILGQCGISFFSLIFFIVGCVNFSPYIADIMSFSIISCKSGDELLHLYGTFRSGYTRFSEDMYTLFGVEIDGFDPDKQSSISGSPYQDILFPIEWTYVQVADMNE